MRFYWRISHHQRKKHVHTPMRKQKTTGRTQRCEQNALSQQLADQPKAATAERKADGDFRLTHSRTGKQEIAGPSTQANIRRCVPGTSAAVQFAAERREESRNPATGGCVRQRIPAA